MLSAASARSMPPRSSCRNVIGGGILFTPPQVAAAVPNPCWFLATWLAGGMLAFAGAMACTELAALRPHAGGEYVYLRAAFGRLAAFLTGWTSFVAGFSGAMAASAVVLAFYVGRFIPAASDATPLFVVPLPCVPLTVSKQALVALAAIAAMAWIHLRGVGPGRAVMNVLAGLKVSALVIFIALGFPWATDRRPRGSGGSGRRRRVAARADSGDVHLLGLERRRVRRPKDPQSRPQRAACPRARYARRRDDLLLLNLLFLYVLPVNSSRRSRAACSTSSPSGCSACAPAT